MRKLIHPRCTYAILGSVNGTSMYHSSPYKYREFSRLN